VPVASKNTDRGATPDVRAGTSDSVRLPEPDPLLLLEVLPPLEELLLEELLLEVLPLLEVLLLDELPPLEEPPPPPQPASASAPISNAQQSPRKTHDPSLAGIIVPSSLVCIGAHATAIFVFWQVSFFAKSQAW
jgi:hypothetical protein